MKKSFFAIFFIAAGLGIGTILFFAQRRSEEPLGLDSFAKCLSDKGIVMYGAYWCPHCQNQKAMFGEAFKFIRYVECTQEPQRCIAAGIKAYPTWIFPGGVKRAGTQELEALAQLSACPLPSARRSRI